MGDKRLIQVYTGDGKGKTTAALGQALRAVGHNWKVYFLQFFKGGCYSGELFAAQRLYPNLFVKQFGWGCPNGSLMKENLIECTGCGQCFRENRRAENGFAKTGLREAKLILDEEKPDILVLDEISYTITYGLLELEEVLDILKRKPENTEIILTGRDMPKKIIELADLVTEMKMIKHPYQANIKSRWGIEY